MERKGNGVFTFLNFNYLQNYFTGKLGEPRPWLIKKFLKKSQFRPAGKKSERNLLKPFLWKCGHSPLNFPITYNCVYFYRLIRRK